MSNEPTDAPIRPILIEGPLHPDAPRIPWPKDRPNREETLREIVGLPAPSKHPQHHRTCALRSGGEKCTCG
jgi:hypothetical protein